MPSISQETDTLLRVRGIVQGVGFRPFVQRAATQRGLCGWVRNDPQGVLIRVAGTDENVAAFERALRDEAPPAARVQSIERQERINGLAPAGDDFSIIASETAGLAVEAAVPPDLALCADCKRELLEPLDRRHRYPFINCTQCGPRYSILESLPYDRPRTTMRTFRMCASCQREYDDPSDRRFHAQPNACPECGPRVMLTDSASGEISDGGDPVETAARLLIRGGIVAVKGVGGFHLFADATNDTAVAELRRRKHREEKPFAVMFRDLEALRAVAEVSEEAAALLESPAAPIVLLPRRANAGIADNVAPGNPWIGALLAYAPLHVLLMQMIDRPMVATSANLAEEPLCTEGDEARARLSGIADAFLDHNRPIAHPVDDSVVRLSTAGPILLRRARGYAPAPLSLPDPISGSWLCVGGHMKNTVAVAAGDRLVLSPHIGDLAGTATLGVFRRTAEMLGALHGTEFTAVACDKHPDYASTRYAEASGLPRVAVQHHLAHVLACLLENHHPADGVLGVAWDGTGYGEDATVWGGEFILVEKGAAQRFGRLRPFRLAGSEAAVRDPRRSALGLLHEAGDKRFAAQAAGFGFAENEITILDAMLTRGINSPVTSSAGRLFDAVGALLGLGRQNRFEGQTPLAVEAAAVSSRSSMATMPLPVRDVAAGCGAVCELDWQPLLDHLLAARAAGIGAPELAAAFHRALAEAIVRVARRAGVGAVALSGGCFQNALLLELTVSALRESGFAVLTHRELPPNDGNIAAGQALGALWGLTSVTMP